MLQRVSDDPNDAEALTQLAEIALFEDDVAEATAYANSAVRANPDLAEGWNTWILVHLTRVAQAKEIPPREAMSAELQRAGRALLAICEREGTASFGLQGYIEYCRTAEAALKTGGDLESAARAHTLAVQAAADALRSSSPTDRLVGEGYLKRFLSSPVD